MTIESPVFTIRTATVHDAQLLGIVASTSFYEAYFEQDDSHNLAAYCAESFAEDKLADELADPTCSFFLLLRNDRAVGYAKMRRGTTAEGVTPEVSIELQRIYTVERVYGTGAGALLLNHCLEFARGEGFEKLWLGVWEENKRAQRFYEKHGFVQVGTLTFPYGDEVGINYVMNVDLGRDSGREMSGS